MKNLIIRTLGLVYLMLIAAPPLLAQQSYSDRDGSLAQYRFLGQEEKFFAEENDETFKALQKMIRLDLTEVSVEEALNVIANQAGLKLMYSKNLLPEEKKVTFSQVEMTVGNALWDVLEGTNLQFALSKNNQLVLRRVESGVDNAILQETIRGTVTESGTDVTLPGVNIVVQGTSNGTSTDIDGNFELTVPSLDGILVFSYVGFEPQEVPINGRSELNVQLAPRVYNIGDDVIVTALGIEREVRSLTYASQEVEGSQIDEAKEINVVNSLQGRVAGVNITKNATGPGSESNVTIRGNRSITNSNQPLYVIDGVPTNGSIGMMNSDDVESVTVLKGASAAALYGSQGQNGAIIITTRSGQAGDIIVNYNGGVTFETPLVLPELQYEYGQGDAGVYGASSENGWGPKAEGQMVTLWNGSQVPLEGQNGRLSEFFRTGITHNNTISVQGGNERMQSYFSYGNTSADGILRNNDLSRHNLNLKIDNTVSEKFSFSAKLNYIFEDVNNRVSTGGGGNYVLPSIYRAPTTIPLSEMKKYTYTDQSGLERQSYWNPGSSVNLNPYWGMNRILFYQKKDRVMALFSARYNLTDWINFQVRGSFDKTVQHNDRKVYADNYWSQVGSNYNESKNSTQGLYADALMSYTRDFGERFNLSGNFGASIDGSRYESLSADAGGLYKRNYFFMSNAREAFVQTSYGKSPQVQSLYGTATLGYNDYLFLEGTARNDWSSALPKENRSYFYPSIGLSGVLTDMFELPDWISYGKARLSLATSGYGGTEYLDRSYYSVASGGAIITPSIQSLGDYKPELTTSFEAGLDWGFFDDRVGLTFTYYQSKTKNQLLLIGVPPATLYDQKYINAGLIQNSGVEFVADFTPVVTSDFVWNSAVNFSRNVNEVKRLTDARKSIVINEGDNVYLIVVEEGGSYGDMYVRGWAKDDQGRNLVTANGTPILTEGLTEYVGNVNPDFMLGFSNSFSFKDFSLSFLIDHRQGGVVISSTQALIDGYGVSKESLRGREDGIVLDGYTEDGTKNTSAIGAQEYFSLIGGRYPSAGFYNYSGTNTRMREVVFSYSVPARILNSLGFVRDAKLSVVGRDLFFIYRAAPIDPEVTRGLNGRGLEYAALPPTRKIGFNLKLSF